MTGAPNVDLMIGSIASAGLNVEREEVIFQCIVDQAQTNIGLPIALLPRLIALSLHLAGNSELEFGKELVALLPEGWEICAMCDDIVGLRLILPGGAPLTFGFSCQDATTLAEGLNKHLDARVRPRVL